MAGKAETWTTIESDPGVFTELIQEIGVKGVQVEELYALDKDLLESLRPVYGLIFLFKWRPETDERPIAQDTVGKVFFANQVINNACATQAILSILLNVPELDVGQELQQFKEFTADFPPDLKGLAISNSDNIRRAHNSFARPEPIISDESQPASKDNDAFHFISYLPVGRTLYELDGLKPGPIALCPCTDGDWLEKVCPHIQARIERYASSEIRFNLMALIRDRIDVINEQIAEESAVRDAIAQRLSSEPHAMMQVDSAGPSGSEAFMGLPSDPTALNLKALEVEEELARLRELLDHEHDKRRRWHDANIRAKHSYIAFIFNFLKLMAEQGKLALLIEQAKRTAAAAART